MSQRRQVRVSPAFFDRLDELLPDERGEEGEPSTADFLLPEIPALIDVLAEGYEEATLAIDGVPGVRVLIATAAALTLIDSQ